MFSLTILFAHLLASFLKLADGHGYLAGAVVDGKYYPGYNNTAPTHSPTIAWSVNNTEMRAVYPWQYNTTSITCGLSTHPSTLHAPIIAGGRVTFEWAPRAWYSSHVGPIQTYMANCNGPCSSVKTDDMRFFKIDEAGWERDGGGSSAGSGGFTPGSWAVDVMVKQNGTWTVSIPNKIASGNYVLRFEIMALQMGGYGGTEVYPSCINIAVTSNGTDNPEGMKATEFYRPEDAGVAFSLYVPFTEYKIPGPSLYRGAVRTKQAWPDSRVIPFSPDVAPLSFVPD